MASKEVYTCDQCKQDLPDKNISLLTSGCATSREILSIHNFHTSGIAIKPKESGTPWIAGDDKLCGFYIQFCNPDCLKDYFQEKFDNAGKVKTKTAKKK